MRSGQLKASLALILLWATALPAFAQTDSDTNGTGSSHGFAVSDGDTVKFGRQRVRLFGIAAPEKGQPCDGGHWYPGPLAAKPLSLSSLAVRCRVTRWTMTTKTTARSRSALLARTTFRR